MRKKTQKSPVGRNRTPVVKKRPPSGSQRIPSLDSVASSEVFRLLVESSPNGMVMVDQKGVITYANPHLGRLLGYGPGDLAQKKVEMLVPESVSSQHVADRERFFANPSQRQMGKGRGLFARHKNGTEIPVEIGLTPIETSQGIQTLATVVDMRHQKEAEARAELFRLLVEASPNGILMADKSGVITYTNHHLEILLGYGGDDLLGKSVEVLVPERVSVAHSSYRHAFFVNPSQRPMGAGRDLYAKCKDGTEIPVEIGLTPIETANGIQTLATVVDIRHRKEAEEAMVRMNLMLEGRVRERTAELEAINSELEGFSYSISHDLRAPLRHLDGFSQLLMDQARDTSNEAIIRYAKIISGSAKKLGELIDELLVFSRVGRTQMEPALVDLNDVVREVVDEVSRTVDKRKIKWQHDRLPMVRGDKNLLTLVMRNLIDNAVKYTGRETVAEIQIGSRENEQDLVVFVKDNGAGFDMKYADKLFRVFQRLHRSDEFEGVGIGLANVRRIINRHGGDTWAEGIIGVGATFSFSLPRRRVNEPQ